MSLLRIACHGAPGLHAGFLCFSLPLKGTTTHLPPELRARTEDAARFRGWSVSAFIAWAVRQILELEFLGPDNRAFVEGMRRELAGPWTGLDVVNALLSAARKEITAGRLRPGFWMGQLNSVKKSAAQRNGTKQRPQPLVADS